MAMSQWTREQEMEFIPIDARVANDNFRMGITNELQLYQNSMDFKSCTSLILYVSALVAFVFTLLAFDFLVSQIWMTENSPVGLASWPLLICTLFSSFLA